MIAPVGVGTAPFDVIAADPGGLSATSTIEVLVVSPVVTPTDTVCSWVANTLSWVTPKTSGSQAIPSSLFLWLGGVLTLWLDLACT